MISVSRSTRLSPLSPRDAGRPRLFWLWGIYLHLCCHVHFIDARCLCTLSVHVVCALHRCTLSVHFICALHLCTSSVHFIFARCLCTLVASIREDSIGLLLTPIACTLVWAGCRMRRLMNTCGGSTGSRPTSPASLQAVTQAQQAYKPSKPASPGLIDGRSGQAVGCED